MLTNAVPPFFLSLLRSKNGKFLVVVPNTIVTKWANDFQNDCPTLKVISIVGSLMRNGSDEITDSLEDTMKGDFNIFILSFEHCMRNQKILAEGKWTAIIALPPGVWEKCV